MVDEDVIEFIDIVFGINGLLIITNIVLVIVALTLKKIAGITPLLILAAALVTPLFGGLIALIFASDFVTGLGLTFFGVMIGLTVSEVLIFVYLVVSLAKKKTKSLELME